MKDFESRSWFGSDANPDIEIREIQMLTLPKAIALFDYYVERCIDGQIPERNTIDPLTIPRDLITSVYLLQPKPDHSDWIYRLIGNDIVERFRVDRTNQAMRSFLDKDRAEGLIEASNTVAREKKPKFFQLLPHRTVMDHFYAETMSLPVHDENTDDIWLFGGTFFGAALADV